MSEVEPTNQDSQRLSSQISWIDFVIVEVLLVSLVVCVQLATASFSAIHGLAGGTLLTCLFFGFTVKLPKVRAISSWAVLGLLVSLLVRWPPIVQEFGGQDPGVYANLSAHLENHQSQNVDLPLKALFLQEGFSETYWGRNVFDRDPRPTHKDGVYEAARDPGLYIVDSKRGKLTFQLFALLPAWMAIFAKVFGSGHRYIASLFFGLLTLVVFYRLVLFVGKNKITAAVAATLLAFNPIHVFFSRYPASENITLFFLLCTFYLGAQILLLQRPWKGAWLAFFAAVFSLNMARISGFVYLPFVSVGAVILLLTRPTHVCRILFLCLLWLIGFGLSMYYGFRFSYPYFIDVFSLVLGGFLGVNWIKWGLVILAIVLAAPVLMAWYQHRISKSKGWNWELAVVSINKLGVLIVGLILIGALYRSVRFSFFDDFAGAEWVQRFNLGGRGFLSFQNTTIGSLLTFLSLPCSLLFICALVWLFKMPNLILATLFSILGLGYGILAHGYVPEHYYFDRYLLVEAIPSSVLVISLFVGEKWKQWGHFRSVKVLAMFLAVGTFYSSFAAISWQLAYSPPTAVRSLAKVVEDVDVDDLIILETDSLDREFEFRMPLEFLYGRRILLASQNLGELKWWAVKVGRHFNQVYLLSGSKLVDPWLTRVNRGTLENRYLSDTTVPRQVGSWTSDWHLYSIDWSKLAIATGVLIARHHERKYGFWDDGLWSRPEGSVEGLDMSLAKGQHLVLGIAGHRGKDGYKQLDIKVNERPCPVQQLSDTRLKLNCLSEMNRIRSISWLVPALQRDKLGNGDNRALGLDIVSIEILN